MAVESQLDGKSASQRRRGRRRPCLEPLEERPLLTSIIDLGALPGGSGNYSYATGINDSGEVVGDSLFAGVVTAYQAFLWSPATPNGMSGTMSNLGTPPGDLWSSAAGINDAGQVVGSLVTAMSEDSPHAFLYNGGAFTDLGTLPYDPSIGEPGQGVSSQASGINDSGQVVGESGTTDGIPAGDRGASDHAFLNNDGTMTDLGTLAGLGGSSVATGINDSGQVVGYSDFGPNATHAFLYSGGTMTDLGTLPGDLWSWATGINDSGQVVGYSWTPGDTYFHAFLYTGGVMTDLGTLGGSVSEAFGINDSGQVVGESGGLAFLYSPATGMVDLNSLLPANSGWVLSSATAINNNGQIVGVGENPEGNDHAFLLDLSEIVPTSLAWNATEGGVDYSYQIRGDDLSQATTIALYWAPTSAFVSSQDTLISGSVVDTQTAVGTYGPFHLTPDQLGTPPEGTNYLLCVADPDNDVSPADPSKVASLALSDVTLDSVSTKDSREAIVEYEINNPNLTQPFYIQIFRSDEPTYQSDDPNNVAVGQPYLVTDLQPGHYETDPVIDLSGPAPDEAASPVEPLAPDPSLPYVLAVVVDAQGEAPEDLTVDETQAQFKIWVVADVTQGFGATNAPWVQDMVNALKGAMPAGASFDSVLPFYWNSLLPLPGQTVSGGNLLYQQILQQADAIYPQLGKNDVIDVQLIGHSRGSAVIGQAMQDLVDELAPEEQALEEGYYKLTFLDPHPANLNTVDDVSINLGAPTYELEALILYAEFSAAYDDPPVVVNSRVNQVEDFYEQNSISSISTACKQINPIENYFNLTGDPSQIHIQDPVNTVTNDYDLSPLGLGHSDVWRWYMDNVIQTLGTGSVPPLPASSGGSAPPPGNLNLQQILYPQYIDDQSEANALVGDLATAGTDLDQGNYSQAISELQTFDSAVQTAPTADFSANSAPLLVSICQELIGDVDSTDVANINSATAQSPNVTASVEASDPANNQQVSGTLTTGSQFSGTAQFSVGNYAEDPNAGPAGQVSQGTFDVQATGIDASADASASVTFTAQVPTQQLEQAALSYFGDDGQWHIAAFYNGSAWVQVGPSGNTPIHEQDTPVSGSGMSTISLPVDFDNNTTPAVGDLGGTVFALTVPAPISLSPMPGGTVNTSFDQTISASGGTGDKTLLVSNITGSIPGLPIPTAGTNSLAIIGAPTAAGTVSFTVRATDSVGIPFSQNYTLTVTTADPSQSIVSISPSSINAGGTATVTLTAIGTSGARETSGGLDVAFGLVSGTGTGTFSAVTDNGDGTYTAVFTGITAGNNTITATMNGQPVTTSAPAGAVAPGPVDLAESTMSAPASALPVGGTATVTLTAKDSYGNQESAGGLLVGFGLDSAVGTFSQVADNGDGTYSATFTARSPGTGTYEATINDQAVISQPAGITVVPLSLAQSSVTVAPATVPGDGTTTVTLTARDVDGAQETTGGFTVAFGLSSGTGSGTFGPVTDNGNGTYTATFFAGIVGSKMIFATIDGFTVTTDAAVTVTNWLKVISDPTSQGVSAGNTVSFVAAVAGSPAPTVQWQVRTDGGTAFSNVAGTTSTTLTFTPTASQSGDEYRAVFTNSSGSATTAAATLTVNRALATLTLRGLTFSYDGAPHTATVSTDPQGVTGVTVIYSQNHVVVPAPTQAGSYSVTATLNNPNYTATSVTGTLVINPAAPYIIGEQPLFHRKTNKKGKPVGSPVLAGFTFDFSDALNLASATRRTNYQVDSITIKRVKKKTQPILHPITSFSVTYSAAGDSVTLTFGGKQTFPTGGQITVASGPSAGVTGTSGIGLAGTTVFTVSTGGRIISPH